MAKPPRGKLGPAESLWSQEGRRRRAEAKKQASEVGTNMYKAMEKLRNQAIALEVSHSTNGNISSASLNDQWFHQRQMGMLQANRRDPNEYGSMTIEEIHRDQQEMSAMFAPKAEGYQSEDVAQTEKDILESMRMDERMTQYALGLEEEAAQKQKQLEADMVMEERKRQEMERMNLLQELMKDRAESPIYQGENTGYEMIIENTASAVKEVGSFVQNAVNLVQSTTNRLKNIALNKITSGISGAVLGEGRGVENFGAKSEAGNTADDIMDRYNIASFYVDMYQQGGPEGVAIAFTTEQINKVLMNTVGRATHSAILGLEAAAARSSMPVLNSMLLNVAVDVVNPSMLIGQFSAFLAVGLVTSIAGAISEANSNRDRRFL
jgi:hypothetical protein